MLTRGRRGTSLVELIVALVLFGVIGIATLRSLDAQARLHSGVLAILEARAQHAAAHEAVATQLRGASGAAGDVVLLTDSSVVFRLPVGTGVACAIASGAIVLAPDSVTAGQAFARFRTSPQPGDTAWVLDENATDVAADDRWIGVEITAATRNTGLCAQSPLVDPVLDASLASWRLSYAGTLITAAGAAVRLTRIARFALYRSGSDSWLGFTEVNPSTRTWVTIQPVSGPYLPFSAAIPSTSGIWLRGIDSSGAASAVTPATIVLTSRTRTSRTVRIEGLTAGRHADSLQSLIALRNAR